MLTQNVSNVNERESNHLYELALTGLQYNIKFMSSYRDYLYDGITNLIMALSRHNSIFLFWLKKLSNPFFCENMILIKSHSKSRNVRNIKNSR